MTSNGMVMGASMYWVRKAVSFVAVGRDALLAGSGGHFHETDNPEHIGMIKTSSGYVYGIQSKSLTLNAIFFSLSSVHTLWSR